MSKLTAARSAVFCLLTFLAASVTTPTKSQDYNCVKYARHAVVAYRMSNEYYCGFGGPQWSNDFVGHREWCKRAQYNSIIREVRIRTRLIDLCLRATTDCDAYAEVAVAQNWHNKNWVPGTPVFGGHSTRCGSGPRWHDDREDTERHH